MNTIKVKDTRMHKTIPFPNAIDVKEGQIPIAEAQLVLVKCIWQESIFAISTHGMNNIYLSNKEKRSLCTYYKPILISLTEKIEAGDWKYNPNLNNIWQHNREGKGIGDVVHKDTKKVLALPEHFSPKHLQAIVDGKMKDGQKVLVECFKWETYTSRPNPNGKDCKDIYDVPVIEYYIKQGCYIDQKSSKTVNHDYITLRKIEIDIINEIKQWATKNKYHWGLYNGNIAVNYESLIKFLDGLNKM